MNTLICGYRDDSRQWEDLAEESQTITRGRNVEAYTDELLSDCRVLANAQAVNSDNDLYDGDLLPKLITEICKWNGSSLNATIQMKAMFNLLANEFQAIAEREVK